jgi:hypothetical protein
MAGAQHLDRVVLAVSTGGDDQLVQCDTPLHTFYHELETRLALNLHQHLPGEPVAAHAGLQNGTHTRIGFHSAV